MKGLTYIGTLCRPTNPSAIPFVFLRVPSSATRSQLVFAAKPVANRFGASIEQPRRRGGCSAIMPARKLYFPSWRNSPMRRRTSERQQSPQAGRLVSGSAKSALRRLRTLKIR